jgi:hypothetical protein
VGGQALFLRGATKDVFMGYLRSQRPDLVPMYEQLYGKRTWLADAEKKRVEAPLRRLAQRYVPDLADRFQGGSRTPTGATAAEVATGRVTPVDVVGAAERRRPQPVQEVLF